MNKYIVSVLVILVTIITVASWSSTRIKPVQKVYQQLAVTDDIGIIEFLAKSKARLGPLSDTEIASRGASVRIEVIGNPKKTKMGSGVLVLFMGKQLVLTAGHLANEEGAPYKIFGRNGEFIIGEAIYVDKKNDFAILNAKQMETRTPIKLKLLSSIAQIGVMTTYTGFPNGYDLLTIGGRIIGYDKRMGTKKIIMHSFAWPGASGSGVFDDRGNLVGILIAIGVGRLSTLPFRQLNDSLVYVTPSNVLSRSKLRELICKRTKHKSVCRKKKN